MQWIWLEASTVKGIPSNDLLQTTQVKQPGWYGFPVARRIRSRIGFVHTQHFSSVFCKLRKIRRQIQVEKINNLPNSNFHNMVSIQEHKMAFLVVLIDKQRSKSIQYERLVPLQYSHYLLLKLYHHILNRYLRNTNIIYHSKSNFVRLWSYQRIHDHCFYPLTVLVD